MTCVTEFPVPEKSSLSTRVLYKKLAKELNRAWTIPGKHKRIEGLEQVDKVIDIDQSPIGRTPRSILLLTGVFDLIRDLFAATPDATRGIKGRFSFNVKGGRCEACSGDGILKLKCISCRTYMCRVKCVAENVIIGETLDAKYKGKVFTMY